MSIEQDRNMSGEADLGLRTVEPTAESKQDPLSLSHSDFLKPSKPRVLSGWQKIGVSALGAASGFTGIGLAVSPMKVEASRIIPSSANGGSICTPEFLNSHPEAFSNSETDQENVLITFTNEKGETLKISIEPCPPSIEKIEKDQIDISLSEWTTPNEDGQYNKVPIDQKYKNWEYYANLNIMPDQEKAIEKGLNAFFQGSPRGFEKIVGSDGKTYLIAYIGQELKLGRGDQYYIALNVGEVSDREDIPYFKSKDLPPTGIVRYFSPERFMRKIKKDKPQVVGFGVNGSPIDVNSLPPGFEEFAIEYDKQTVVAKALIEYSKQIQEAGSFEDVPIPEILKFTINNRLKDGDEVTSLPMLLTPVSRK